MGRPRKNPIVTEQQVMPIPTIERYTVQETPKAPDPIAMVSTPNYEGLFHKIDSLSGLDKQSFCKTLSMDEKRAYVRYLKERDAVKMTGVFRCFEPLGGTVTFTAMAFDGESPTQYTFVDGESYTVPKYIIKRMEQEYQGVGCWYPTHAHILDAMGNPIVGIGKKNRRFGFSTAIF